MARTHTFKGSASAGYGYAAFIEDGQLVITEDWGREGGVLYRGPYQHAQIAMSQLRANAPKLANSIDSYYFEECRKVSNAPAKEETITHQFKDSRDHFGYGYHAFIERGQLVICHEAPREGGVLFRGTYTEAAERGWLATLLKEDQRLYHDIDLYFIKHGVKDDTEDLKKKHSFDEETKTILFKVKLFMDNREVHNVLVRGRFQSSVVEKLMPKIPEVLMLQTWDAREFAVRSEKISAVEFVED